MLRNGLYFVASEAAAGVLSPLARAYRASLILGSLREDVIVLPLFGSVRAAEARRQALELIPDAVSHVRALVDSACRAMLGHGPSSLALLGSELMRDEDDVLEETLGALDLPERMLKPWFDHNRAFCDQHGGRRVYPGLLELLDRCDAALQKRQQGGRVK